ncbi:glycosyltransferase family 2 protein [Rhodoferax sp.]|uniref:glycosyltransferase family 2 protein n=1 Tax=Rhodoferax sp. TaxID=50421 RepID=UPI0026050A37|nr:glycosyltransferase family 2 protein [Rhodoferax sp.]MDD2808099.1 glycosyltransferase family 2 protein [Rhodoferax sp.]
MTSRVANPHPEPTAKVPVALSVVVPLYNERAVLPLLLERLTQVLQPLGISYELVLVDDGSHDGSGVYLLEQAARNPTIVAVRLSRNFGKEAALSAGMDVSSGDAVVILDADLQDPPELIGSMLEAMRAGADIVTMKRRTRAGESWGKRLSAHLFYRLMSRISHFKIPEDTGDFRLMSRRAVNALNSLPERNRYMKGLFAWVGFPTHVIEYDRDPRAAGNTKWNLLGLIGLALEGITSFSIVPLRWASALGLLAAGVGMSFGLWIVVGAVFHGNPVAGYPSMIAVTTFLGGVQLLSVGLLGEYVGKTYFETKQRPLYVLRDVVQSPRQASQTPTPLKD